MDMICKQLITIQLDSSRLAFPFFPVASDWSKNAIFGVSVGCLEGVWEVSGGFLAHSGLCVGHINAKSIVLNPVGIITLVCFIFFQWPSLVFGRAARPKAKSEIAPFSLCPLRFSKIVPSSGHYCQQKNSPRILLAHKSAKT